jgi:hypothetical protein
MFQERFMESWPEHLARHSYDAFWMENEPTHMIMVRTSKSKSAKVCRASGERLDYVRAKTLMTRPMLTRPMLTRGTMKEALQDVTKVSIDVRKGEDDPRDDNPSVVHKLIGR